MFAYEDMLGSVKEWKDAAASSSADGKKSKKGPSTGTQKQKGGDGEATATGNSTPRGTTTNADGTLSGSRRVSIAVVPAPPQTGRGAKNSAGGTTGTTTPRLPPIGNGSSNSTNNAHSNNTTTTTPRRNIIPLRQAVTTRAITDKQHGLETSPRDHGNSNRRGGKGNNSFSDDDDEEDAGSNPSSSSSRGNSPARRARRKKDNPPQVMRAETINRLATPRAPTKPRGAGGEGNSGSSRRVSNAASNTSGAGGDGDGGQQLKRSDSLKAMQAELDERQRQTRQRPGEVPFRNGGTHNVGWFKHLPTPPAIQEVRRELSEKRKREGAKAAEEKLVTRLYAWPIRPKEKYAPEREPLTEEEENKLVSRLYVVKNRNGGDDDDEYEWEEGDEEEEEVDLEEQVDRLYYKAVDAQKRKRDAAQERRDRELREMRNVKINRGPLTAGAAGSASPRRNRGGGGEDGADVDGEDEEEDDAIDIKATVDRLYDKDYYDRRVENAFKKAGYLI